MKHPKKILKWPRRGSGRALTDAEIKLAQSVFGDSINYSQVRIYNEKFFPLQPKNVAMAPNGNLFFHPAGSMYVSDFGFCNLQSQGLFIHEMTHVWQKQTGTNVILRGIYQRNYSYCLSSGKPFSKYNIEQQGDIVRDYFYLKNDSAGGPAIERYKNILPF